ncbi:Hypothetical_protein [Hexamita inflata]|uniref:Hypothetical_protein n=1 Tax=Hexamita inflata TaxID=28002 RepID=A0AA86U053_9EUKA|nr:Hypothetical protein HINF_LOCUS22741 [Hexamita inflata]
MLLFGFFEFTHHCRRCIKLTLQFSLQFGDLLFERLNFLVIAFRVGDYFGLGGLVYIYISILKSKLANQVKLVRQRLSEGPIGSLLCVKSVCAVSEEVRYISRDGKNERYITILRLSKVKHRLSHAHVSIYIFISLPRDGTNRLH